MKGCMSPLALTEITNHAEQARAEDLRLFVEVLQEFCNDPRQEAEVRASEARLKHEVSTLQNQMASSNAARLQVSSGVLPIVSLAGSPVKAPP